VLAYADIPPDQPPFLGEQATRVTLRRDATVAFTRTQHARPLDEFDLDVRLAARLPAPPEPATFGCPDIGFETVQITICRGATCLEPCDTRATICDDATCDVTCRTCRTCRTCQTQCGQATCHTCETCQTQCGQATCQTCQTCQTQCGQATCQTCQTCQTQCGQATCQTCLTRCRQETCITCETRCGGTCNPHVFTCGPKCRPS
jgi:hypothetical protein